MAEKRLQPEVDYERNLSNAGYLEAKEDYHDKRMAQEHNLRVMRMSAINGNSHAGRKIQGVTNISGNPNALFSSTKQDGARMTYYNTGVPGVVEETSKQGAPITPGDELPWEYTAGSETTAEGEM